MSYLPAILGTCLAAFYFREAWKLRRGGDVSRWRIRIDDTRREAAVRYFSRVAVLAGVFFLSVLVFYVLPRRYWGVLAPLPLALVGSMAYGVWHFAPPRGTSDTPLPKR